MSGRVTVWTDERIAQVKAVLRECSGDLSVAAERLGVDRPRLKTLCHDKGIDYRAMKTVPPFEVKAGFDPRGLDLANASSDALRARVLELERQIATAAPIVEEGSAEPGSDSLLALLFDLHLPEHERPAWSSFLKWCREQRPNEVILSEFAEWLSASAHGNSSWGRSWTQECADVRRGLVQLRSVVGNDCKLVWQESNHDTRLTRILEDRLPSFAGALTIANELKLSDLGIEWVNERTVLRRGQLKILHGHQLEGGSSTGRGALPKWYTAKAIQLYGERNATVVFGHVHREQLATEPCDGGFKRAVSIPCMRTLSPIWHKGREMGHQHGFGAAYIASGGSTNLYTVHVNGGSFTWNGRRYSSAA